MLCLEQDEEKIMNVVREHKEIIQSEIPRLAGLDSKTVSIVTRDLENKGHLKRKKVLHQSRWTYMVICSEEKETVARSTYEADKIIEALGNISSIRDNGSLSIIEASAGGLNLEIEVPKNLIDGLNLSKNTPIAISLKINPKKT